MIYKPSIESHELFIYAINTGDLYRKNIIPTVKNLAKHYKKGVYNTEKAIISYFNIATLAAKLYNKEFSSYGYNAFSVSDRYTVATDLEKYYFENVINNDL